MTPWVRNLLLANIVIFFICQSVPGVADALAFRPGLIFYRPWTPVTYMFVHASISHIFFNMLGLYFFGSRLEARLGERNFLVLYFVSGLMGAAGSFFFNPLSPIVGASAAIFGIMLGYARYWPRDLLYVWGVVPVQARWLVFIMTGLELFFGGTGLQAGVAHFAHLGGFAGALLYLTWLDRNSPAARFKAKATPPAVVRVVDVDRWKNIRLEGMHPLNQQEVERILQKIAVTGIGSITPDERAFLDRMSP